MEQIYIAISSLIGILIGLTLTFFPSKVLNWSKSRMLEKNAGSNDPLTKMIIESSEGKDKKYLAILVGLSFIAISAYQLKKLYL
jgi:hypothetical protein